MNVPITSHFRYHFCPVLYRSKPRLRGGSPRSRRTGVLRFQSPSVGCWVEMVQVGKQEAQDVPDPGPSCMARLVSLHLSLRALQGPESACVGG